MPPLWGEKWGVGGGQKLTPAQTRRRERVSPCSRLGALATRPELVSQVPNGQQKNEESIFILWVCAVRESFREKALKLCDLLGERTPHKKLGFSIPQRLTVSVLKNHQVCLK